MDRGFLVADPSWLRRHAACMSGQTKLLICGVVLLVVLALLVLARPVTPIFSVKVARYQPEGSYAIVVTNHTASDLSYELHPRGVASLARRSFGALGPHAAEQVAFLLEGGESTEMLAESKIVRQRFRYIVSLLAHVWPEVIFSSRATVYFNLTNSPGWVHSRTAPLSNKP